MAQWVESVSREISSHHRHPLFPLGKQPSLILAGHIELIDVHITLKLFCTCLHFQISDFTIKGACCLYMFNTNGEPSNNKEHHNQHYLTRVHCHVK